MAHGYLKCALLSSLFISKIQIRISTRWYYLTSVRLIYITSIEKTGDVGKNESSSLTGGNVHISFYGICKETSQKLRIDSAQVILQWL